jgi:hypothetical protein
MPLVWPLLTGWWRCSKRGNITNGSAAGTVWVADCKEAGHGWIRSVRMPRLATPSSGAVTQERRDVEEQQHQNGGTDGRGCSVTVFGERFCVALADAELQSRSLGSPFDGQQQ